MTFSAANRREYERQWYQENRARHLATSRAAYQRNREKRLQQTKTWAKAHPDLIKKTQKKHRNTHLEEHHRRNKEWYATQGKSEAFLRRKREYRRLRYLRNRELILSRNKRWRDSNKARITARDMKRRALKKSASINLRQITEWIANIKQKRFATCYYCGTRTKTDNIHFDHIVALANGGAHSIENLCVSCEFCNLSKGSKPVRLWIQSGQQLLEL